MPTEPLPSPWLFPDPEDSGAEDVVAIGADLEPGTLLAAYRAGLFPMPAEGIDAMVWWSPDPRGVLPLDGLRVSRSLRRSCARFEIRIDSAFPEVIDACADPRRPQGWISSDIRSAYLALHDLGWAHSVEAWAEDGTLAGGLYGVGIGGLFAGESMFHRRTDASKVALVALVGLMRDEHAGARLLDVQWRTDHLASLGVVEVPRRRYLRALSRALRCPPPAAFAPGSLGPVSG
ncbi:MAG: Leucyl/phenylalanyl-tRNA--protein transferase [uncultured Solirubrobacteraceae bacterium]|uniref:Leucyl/phenylalanyl-tRNA--protein transferase n=1 Tax=uncultured Solirubrobacteraceae bacterium TaxID=1162706 RepID=A0A6J4RWB6_9ACTN|nr:MAG: Leucyl/phenylalanyl-tRNA--protein transferase [uncultured Solirubrobacteraceae bacterium]